jgi:hypothetical protein
MNASSPTRHATFAAILGLAALVATSNLPCWAAKPLSGVQVTVEAEELVYPYQPANNGAGPMWCRGSTCLVRMGDTLFASGLETLPDVQPLHNCRWTLHRRENAGWRQILADPEGRTREPAPLVVLNKSTFCLSANPTLVQDPQAYSGPARPEILAFARSSPDRYQQRLPSWEGKPKFTEHSYRSFASDSRHGELILLQNIGDTHAEWSFLDRRGQWSAQGKLEWPWGADYEKPEPIRVCYPTVALRDRAVYFCGVSDIIEPNSQWRAFKQELTGQKWDYEFRRLFFTWTPDIRKRQFKEWIEIASRERTCGWITPGDLWVSPEGTAHIVWTERAIDERLKVKFFPEAKQEYTMNYARVRDGKVIHRAILAKAGEGLGNEIPELPRLQITPDRHLYVFYYTHGSDARGQSLSENRLLEIDWRGQALSEPVRVPLRYPLNNYFTATVRAGSSPSTTLDLLGNRAQGGNQIAYAQVRLSTPR